MKNLVLSAVVGLFLVSFVCADAIEPGERVITITNVITNMDDYPDYTFFQVGYLGPNMCPAQVIGSDSVVPGGYKFCGLSVFAVKNSEFDDYYLSEVDQAFEDIYVKARNSDTPVNVQEELDSYLSSTGAKKVISGVRIQKVVPESSTEQSYTEYYTVDLTAVREQPSDVVVERNYLIYLYVVVPLVALLIILFLVINKKRK
ncbi:MAG: hypothetical protein ABIH63_02090 [archaeon]